MKKLTIALMTVLALGSSVVFAEDGSDRTIERSQAQLQSAIDAKKAEQANVQK